MLLDRLLGYLEADPQNLALRTDVFDAALAAGQLSLAQQQTTWVLSRTPTDFGWRHRLAVLDMAQQAWNEAAMLLRSLLAERQSDPVIGYNLAYAEFARGQIDSALEILHPLVDAHLDRVPDALALLLRCLHRQGAMSDGVATFERFLARRPSAQALGVASLLAVDAEQMSKAELWASQALAAEPRQREALVAQASVALARRDALTALARLELALEVSPGDGRTLSAIGMARLLQHDIAAAHTALVQAVAAMPGHIGTWHTLAWCEIVREDLPAAQAAFERALALDRNFGETHGGIAVVQALQGQNALAQESIRRAMRLAPMGLSARYAEAVLKGEAHDPQRFEAMARGILAGQKDFDGRPLAEVVLRQR